jgi:hypothetical protein
VDTLHKGDNDVDDDDDDDNNNLLVSRRHPFDNTYFRVGQNTYPLRP